MNRYEQQQQQQQQQDQVQNAPAFSQSSLAAPNALLRLLRDSGAAVTGVNQGLCNLPVEELLRLLRQGAAVEAAAVPQPFHLLSCAIAAKTTDTNIQLDFVFEILQLEAQWAAVPLLPSSLAVLSQTVARNVDAADKTTNTAVATHDEAFFAVRDGRHVFFSRGAGRHRVTLAAACPYTSLKVKNGFRLADIAPASIQTLQVTLPGVPGVEVTVEPCCTLTTSSMTDGTNGTVASANLPPTPVIDVRWTMAARAAAAAAAAAAVLTTTTTTTAEAERATVAKPISVSVDQQTLVSVSEGVVFVDTKFAYDIRNGSLSKLELELDKRVRVLSVTGDHVQSWKVVGTVCRVFLDQQIQDRYELQLSTELSLNAAGTALPALPAAPATGPDGAAAPAQQTEFVVPVVHHGALPGLTREKGVLGVEAKSNVEVEVIGCSSLAAMDVEELPQDLRQSGGGALVSAFKFLQPTYQLSLSVTKHNDQSVLVAAADAAHFIVTITEEGKLMTKLIMRVRNTQKQYARVSVPENSDIWSSMVDGLPVKPARCTQTKAVMVPLNKSSGTSGQPSAFQVELLWVRPAPFGRLTDLARGTIALSFPSVDLPLNTVFVTVYVPSRLECKPWTGGCRQVPFLRGDVPKENSSNRRVTQARPPQIMQAQFMTNSVQRLERQGSYEGGKAHAVKSSSSKAGVVPVHVDMVVAGQCFYFQRLLVVSQAFDIETTFTRRKVPWRSTRQLDGLLACCHAN